MFMTDGGRVQKTCLITAIIFVLLGGDAGGEKSTFSISNYMIY